MPSRAPGGDRGGGRVRRKHAWPNDRRDPLKPAPWSSTVRALSSTWRCSMHPNLLDAAGHRRQPVTLPGYHAGRPPRNKGRRYPADPPTVEEIIAVMRTAGAGADGVRLRALIVLLWRAGMRIGEALALAETDLDARRGAVLIRHGKGDKRREVGMDSWAWEQLAPWQQLRLQFPVGPLFWVIHGPTAGRNWEPAS